MQIHETGGGGSYHGECWIHASIEKKFLIDIATDYFSNEHNRDNECEDCIKNKCRKKLIRNLKKDNCANFDCTDYADASIVIWRVAI